MRIIDTTNKRTGYLTFTKSLTPVITWHNGDSEYWNKIKDSFRWEYYG